jgi:hypothetical protein
VIEKEIVIYLFIATAGGNGYRTTDRVTLCLLNLKMYRFFSFRKNDSRASDSMAVYLLLLRTGTVGVRWERSCQADNKSERDV